MVSCSTISYGSNDVALTDRNDTRRHFAQGRFLLMLSMMVVQTQGKEAQRKGLVILWIGHGASPPMEQPSPDSYPSRHPSHNGRMFFSMFEKFPIQVRSLHACHDDKRLATTFDRIMNAAVPQLAVRFQSHFGPLPACFQSLRRYGIPKDILPLDEQGNLDNSDFRNTIAWYQTQQDVISDDHQKRPRSDQAYIPHPVESDILLGKGKRGERFRGNQLLRKVIAENYDAYDSGHRRTKLAILHLIYFHLLQLGCRFLEPAKLESSGDSVQWVELTQDEAIGKISMGIRNYRRKGVAPVLLD